MYNWNKIVDFVEEMKNNDVPNNVIALLLDKFEVVFRKPLGQTFINTTSNGTNTNTDYTCYLDNTLVKKFIEREE